MDPSSGDIIVSRQVEALTTYIVNISAQDEGGLSTITQIILRINDTNNNRWRLPSTARLVQSNIPTNDFSIISGPSLIRAIIISKFWRAITAELISEPFMLKMGTFLRMGVFPIKLWLTDRMCLFISTPRLECCPYQEI